VGFVVRVVFDLRLLFVAVVAESEGVRGGEVNFEFRISNFGLDKT